MRPEVSVHLRTKALFGGYIFLHVHQSTGTVNCDTLKSCPFYVFKVPVPTRYKTVLANITDQFIGFLGYICF